MLEFLSDPTWLAPQIDFLLMLQELRSQSPDFVTKFLSSVTILGELAIPALICAICYWCVNFKKGIYLFCLMGFHFIISTTFKMFACVYRPWVLSDKIHPVKEALGFAKGYSFPSGHSSMVASLFGGISLLVKKYWFISIFLILIIFLVGFSRLWLGVHTPQDVVVGLLIGFSLVFLINSIINWAEKSTNRYLYLLSVIDIVSIAFLIYFSFFKQYPIDYVNGKILVNHLDPLRAQIVCFAFSLGIIDGFCICRRFFPYDASEGSIVEKLLRAIIGTVFIFIFNHFGVDYSFSDNSRFTSAFIISFFIGLFITLIYPIIFTKIRGKIIKR